MKESQAKKILVVDDEKDTVEMIAALLELEGYQVLPAFSGREALKILEIENQKVQESETPVDLILLDILLGDGDLGRGAQGPRQADGDLHGGEDRGRAQDRAGCGGRLPHRRRRVEDGHRRPPPARGGARTGHRRPQPRVLFEGQLDRGYVKTSHLMATDEPGIYAIGDVVALPDRLHPQLAHVASAEGIGVAERLAGKSTEPVNYDRVPSATYCRPETAGVGLTEAEARRRGYEVKVGKFAFGNLAKPRIVGHDGGFVKVVAESRYDEVLGIHIIGPHATS